MDIKPTILPKIITISDLLNIDVKLHKLRRNLVFLSFGTIFLKIFYLNKLTFSALSLTSSSNNYIKYFIFIGCESYLAISFFIILSITVNFIFSSASNTLECFLRDNKEKRARRNHKMKKEYATSRTEVEYNLLEHDEEEISRMEFEEEVNNIHFSQICNELLPKLLNDFSTDFDSRISKTEKILSMLSIGKEACNFFFPIILACYAIFITYPHGIQMITKTWPF